MSPNKLILKDSFSKRRYISILNCRNVWNIRWRNELVLHHLKHLWWACVQFFWIFKRLNTRWLPILTHIFLLKTWFDGHISSTVVCHIPTYISVSHLAPITHHRKVHFHRKLFNMKTTFSNKNNNQNLFENFIEITIIADH